MTQEELAERYERRLQELRAYAADLPPLVALRAKLIDLVLRTPTPPPRAPSAPDIPPDIRGVGQGTVWDMNVDGSDVHPGRGATGLGGLPGRSLRGVGLDARDRPKNPHGGPAPMPVLVQPELDAAIGGFSSASIP